MNKYPLKKSLLILLLFVYCTVNAQDKYPTVLHFIANSKNTSADETNASNESFHFLMLSPNKAIDLKDYGNEKCVYQIVASNENRIILEFKQPSKLISTGRCASGEEKGFVYFELDDTAHLIKSITYLTESCLWSIEIIDKQEGDLKKIYVSEHFQNSSFFTTTINIQNVTILKQENQNYDGIK